MNARVARFRLRASLMLFLGFGVALPLFPQADQGAITGTIKDSSGGSIPGAAVALTNIQTNLKLEAKTDQGGVYTFQPVKIGQYLLQVSMPGFQTATQNGIQLHVAERLGVDITLQPGNQQQVIEVAASNVAQLQTEDASVGQVFTTQQINDTPLAGRNYVFIAQLSAGVAPSNGSRGQGNGDFSANGQRATQNNFILDGVDNNSNAIDFLNGASYVVRPPPDALQEFKVQTGDFSAEFGHSAGAVVNASIKSGTNNYNGNLWEYFRNDALNATDLFASSKPKYRQNQFGGTFGGRIIKDKLFFFVDTEQNLIRQGSSGFRTVPTALMRTGDFSELLNTSLTSSASPIRLYQPGSAGTIPLSCNGRPNVLCPNQIDPVALKLINLYPLPNTNGGRTYNNYFAQPTASDDTRQFDIRMDYNISTKDQIFARYSWSNEVTTHPPVFGAADGGGSNNLNYGQNAAISETHAFSSNLVNEFRAGYNWGHFSSYQPNASNLTYASQQFGLNGIPAGQLNGGLPNFSIGGFSQLGSNWFLPSDEFENVYQILDNLTKVAGSHTVRGGVSFQKIRYSTLQPNTGRGALSFSGKYTGQPGTPYTGFGGADFLADYMDSANLSSVSPNQNARWYRAVYVQDDWKVSSRLTMNFGLRYDYFQPPYEKHDNDALFSNTGVLTPGGGTGVYLLPNSKKNVALSPQFLNLLAKDNIQLQYSSNRSLIQSQKTNFAPRFGLAYRVTDKLVVRTGFGLFFGGTENLGNFPNLAVNYPFDIEQSFQSAGCGVTNGAPVCPTNGLTLENGFTSSVFGTPQLRGADPQWKSPYSEQYNFTTQYAVTSSLTATVGYVGNVSRHLPVVIFLNGSAALVAPGVNTIPYRPFPDFGSFGYITDNAISSYNSLQASLSKRYSHGLDFLVSYTLAHSLDDAREPLPSNGDGGNRSYELIGIRPDYTSSPFDVRHRFTISGTYQLPFGKGRTFLNQSTVLDMLIGGWSLTPAFQAQTGQPFTVGSSTGSVNGANAFPNLISDPFHGGGTPNATNPNITCPASVRNSDHWYNPCAFANPPLANAILPGQVITSRSQALAYLGSARNQIYGPGFFRLDTSLFKNFTISERRFVQFRADMFNVTNTPSLGNPNGNLGNNGGQITGLRFLGNYTPNARFFQFALKLYF